MDVNLIIINCTCLHLKCLPGSFKKNLPDGETIMILEGELGWEFNVKYIDRTKGLIDINSITALQNAVHI